jgi:large subunit ribosomal protein L21
MFAIIAAGGRQFRVTEGDRIAVDRIPKGVGESLTLDSVLLVGGDGQPLVGTPFVRGAAVEATVVGHRPGRKVVVFKYKPKKHQRRKHGHRAQITELRIGAIHGPQSSGRAGKQAAAKNEKE